MAERLTPEQRARAREIIIALDVGSINARDYGVLGWQWMDLALDDLEALEKENAELSAVKWYRESFEQLKAEHATLRAQLEAAQKELERMSSKAEAFDGGRTQYFDALLSIREAVTGEPDNKPRVPDTLARIAALRARCEQLQRENEALVNASNGSPTR